MLCMLVNSFNFAYSMGRKTATKTNLVGKVTDTMPLHITCIIEAKILRCVIAHFMPNKWRYQEFLLRCKNGRKLYVRDDR